MSPRSGAGEAQTRYARFSINRSPHPSTETGQLQIAAAPGQPSLDYNRVALFANACGPRAKGVLGLLWGTDKPAGAQSLATKGGFLLGEILLTERWAGYARYDYANREVPVGDAETTDRPTIGVSFWAQTQVRLTLESQFLRTTGSSRDRSAMAELMWAF